MFADQFITDGRRALSRSYGVSRNAVILIAVAALLRLAALALVWGRAYYGDPLVYLDLAHNLLFGQGYITFGAHYGSMAQRAFYPPLYPFLLAAVGVVAPLSQPTIFAVNFAIDLGVAWVIAKLSSQLGFKPLMAAAIYLLWPSNILFAPIPQKEGLVSLLVVTAAWFAVRKCPVRFGVAAGLLALAQPALAPLPFIFALLLRVPIIVAGLTAAFVMLPWWIRNYFVFGTFVPLTTGSGYGLWVGTFSPDGGWLRPPQRLLVGDEFSFSRLSAREVWSWITSHPSQFGRHCLGKLLRATVNGWWPVDNLVRMTPGRPELLALLPFTIGLTSTLTALGIFGGVVVRGVVGRLLLACLLQVVLFNLWFEFSERHTYFILPLLSLAVAAGVQQVLRDLREQQILSAHPESSPRTR